MNFNHQKTILLVEDEVLLALEGKLSLEKYGYNVIIANNGEKAVSLALNNENLHLILMDIDLGRGIDGTQAARQILEHRNIPILFYTSHIEKEYVDMVKEITRYGYVIKNSGDFVLQSSIEMAFQLFEANMKVVESEEIQKAMISNISDVIGIIDTEGKIKYKSPNFEKLFGWSPQSVIGLDIHFLIHQDESDEIKKELLMLLHSDKSTKILECRLKCKDGSFKPIELTASNLINDPHIKGILINFHDISQHKRAEEALIDSEKRYRRLHESITDSFVQVIMTGEIVSVNRSFLEMLGYTKEEVFKLTYYKITPAKWHEYEKKIIETQVLPNGYSQLYEKEYIRKDGSIFPVELRTYLLRDGEGKPSGMWAIISDITVRKIAEKALRDSEERFRSLLGSVPSVAVQGYSLDGITNYWNKASELIYGYTREEAIGKNLLDLIIPPEMRLEVEKAIHYMAETGTPIPSAELRLMRKDKSLVSVYSSHSIVKIPGREPELFCIDIDLTERKRAEETLSNERNLLRTLIDNLPENVQVYIKDTSSRYIINNRAHLMALGASLQEETYGKTSLDFFSAGQAKEFLSDDIEIFRSGKTLIEKDEKVYNFTLKEERWHSTTKVPFRNSEGEIVGLVGMTSDITERKKAEKILRDSEKMLKRQNGLFEALLKNLPIGVIMVDTPSGKPLVVNNAANMLFGRGKFSDNIKNNLDEIYNARKFGTSSPYPPEELPIILGMNGQSSHVDDIVVKNPDNTETYLEVFGSPVTNEYGQIWASLASFIDITERKLAEQKINNLLKEKELILKEVHHRIKNNMNTMVGLLTLQAGILKDPEAIAAFKDSSSRVRSMMVLYDKLYRSDNFGELVFKDYLAELVDEIVKMFPHDKILYIEKQVEEFNLSVNTVFSLGIIVNELLTNVIKYAFVGRDEGFIYVSAYKKENRVTFILQDNGVGLPESVDFNNSSGFGMQLVGMLTEQIDGTIKIERNNGTKFILQFEA